MLTIIVGVTGGIAAYKAVGLVRSLVLLGHCVHVIATESALRFVGTTTLEAISGNPLATDLYENVSDIQHVSIAASADLIIIVPATANTIAKLAHGLADNLLTNTVLASTAPIVVAPAMHTAMWENTATVQNVTTLRLRGVHIVGPARGQLTGNDSGLGRLEEPDVIVNAALAFYASYTSRKNSDTQDTFHTTSRDLAGRRIVVTAGGTREPLDPVRFFGNRSSGKQGLAIAQAAVRRGADVLLIAANLDIDPGSSCAISTVSTAAELATEVQRTASDADVIIMAAAVADYRPVSVNSDKLKKEDLGEHATIELVRNPDILAELTTARRKGQVIIGFAAETESDNAKLLARGRSKREHKDVDYLVVNRVGWNEGFSVDNNAVIMLDRAGAIVMKVSGSKTEVADRILNMVT